MNPPPDDERDRDAAGRPRNARPRDALGRPLSRGSAGVHGTPDDLSLTADQTLTEAQRLLDAGLAFGAHEVLESRWKAAPHSERELWRGLAQLAVGVTHAQRGNPVGATELLRRAVGHVERYSPDPPFGIAVAGLVIWARALIARIEQDGLDAVSPADLTPRLRARP
ncbi:MAG: DUF309 domain-containing protein [Kineosporiaceae bacterium]